MQILQVRQLCHLAPDDKITKPPVTTHQPWRSIHGLALASNLSMHISHLILTHFYIILLYTIQTIFGPRYDCCTLSIYIPSKLVYGRPALGTLQFVTSSAYALGIQAYFSSVWFHLLKYADHFPKAFFCFYSHNGSRSCK